MGSAGEEKEDFTDNNLFQHADSCFRLLRKTNDESDHKRRVSQILEQTLLVLEDILERFRLSSCLDNCKEVDKQHICDRIEAHENSTSRWEPTALLFSMRKIKSTRI